MKYKNIKNPYDLLTFMDVINYGVVNKEKRKFKIEDLTLNYYIF